MEKKIYPSYNHFAKIFAEQTYHAIIGDKDDKETDPETVEKIKELTELSFLAGVAKATDWIEFEKYQPVEDEWIIQRAPLKLVFDDGKEQNIPVVQTNVIINGKWIHELGHKKGNDEVDFSKGDWIYLNPPLDFKQYQHQKEESDE